VEPNIDALSNALGVPCVGIVARTGEGTDALKAQIGTVCEQPSLGLASPRHGWPDALDTDVVELEQQLSEQLHRRAAKGSERSRALVRWLIQSLDQQADALPNEPETTRTAVVERLTLARSAGRDPQQEIVAARYQWIDARLASIVGDGVDTRSDPSELIDRWILNPFVGVPLFVVLMGLIFTALFSWADPVIGAIEFVQGWLGDGVSLAYDSAAASMGAPEWVSLGRDLVVDGLIGGVGAVVVFVPQIALLSMFIAIMEDSGYLARAAYLTDRILRLAGLPGRAFVPLLSGFACAVPAIQATRTLPRFRDRLLTMMVLPLTSCSARLPVYTLLIATLFPVTIAGTFMPLRPIILFGMYLFSTVVTVLAAIVLGKTLLPDEATPSIIELPPWRVPSPSQVLRVTWRRTKDFLKEAGGIILVATVVLWALLSFPRYSPETLVPPDEVATLQAQGLNVDDVVQSRALERSYGGQAGKLLEPAIAPLGYDWRIGIGLVGSFAAREVFVSTMGVVHGAGEADAESGALRAQMESATLPGGRRLYTPLVGLSIMVFFALAMQCLSTLAVLKRESGSWKWPAFVFVWMTALAWIAAFCVFQGGRLLGFS
ncbi:MAG: ferrous iron transport protein B, partial [Myxococcota bacterium]